MTPPEFLPQSVEDNDTRLIRAGLIRVFNLAMSKMQADEGRRALQALAGLRREPMARAEPSPAELELEQVRAHLEPLRLAPEGTPAAELARLAVDRLLKL